MPPQDIDDTPTEDEGKRGRKQRQRKPKINPFLNWDQKLDVASNELDELAKESEEVRRAPQ